MLTLASRYFRTEYFYAQYLGDTPMPSATLVESSAHIGDTVHGTYDTFTPIAASIAGTTDFNSFVANAGVWSAVIPVTVSVGSGQLIELYDNGDTRIPAGTIDITATGSGPSTAEKQQEQQYKLIRSNK